MKSERHWIINLRIIILNSLITRSWPKTILLANFISLDVSLASFLGMDGLHFFTFTLQLCVFLIHSLLPTLVTTTTATAIDTTPEKNQDDPNQGRHQNNENVPRNSTLAIIPISVRAISRYNLCPSRVIATFFRWRTPVTRRLPGAVAARCVETLTIDFLGRWNWQGEINNTGDDQQRNEQALLKIHDIVWRLLSLETGYFESLSFLCRLEIFNVHSLNQSFHWSWTEVIYSFTSE